MTPEIDVFTSQDFVDYVEAQDDDYNDQILKGTRCTVDDLLEYMEVVDYDVHVQVRGDGMREGTVLGFTALLETASDVATIVEHFNGHCIASMSSAGDSGAAEIEVHFD